MQALIQMSAAKESNEAKATLDGRVLPSYLAPNHPGEIRMKVGLLAGRWRQAQLAGATHCAAVCVCCPPAHGCAAWPHIAAREAPAS